MKSIFKKIAFVLALAMVVTAFPAKTAAAAAKPSVKAKRVLYIGSDANEQYTDCGWITVYNKTGYTMTFESSNPEVVTVSKRGWLTAVNTGNATVTVTFSKEGAKDITGDCKVTVKKNAAAATLDEESAEAISEMTVGDEVELKAVLTDADGSEEGITDKARFYTKNKDILNVDYKTGKVTAKAAGTAKLYVYGIQWDWDKEAGEYAQTTTTKWTGYDVVVKEPGFASVKQTASKVVAIKCDTEAFAKQVADNVSKLSAAYVVSENPVSVLVKSAAVDNNDKTVVNVTLYNDMIKDKTYQFAFDGGKVVETVAADLTAIDHIVIAIEKAQKATETQIKVDFYDANGIKINAGSNAITYTATPSADYYLTADGKIYFYEAGKTAEVTVVYSMGYDKDGKKIEDKKDTRIITSFDAVSTYSDITGFAYNDAGKGFWDLSFSNDVISVAVGDAAKQLYGRYTVTNYYNQADPNNYTGNAVLGDYKYESTDETKLLVGLDGMVTPVGAGAASVIVSRKVNNNYVVVGVANFSIAANRTLTTFEPSLSKVNLSDSSDDSVKLQMVVKDQLGGGVDSNMKYTLKLVKAVEGVTVTAGGITLSTTESGPLTPDNAGWWESYNKYFTIKATTAPATAKQVQILVTAQQGYGQKYERVVTFNVKAAGSESRYEIGINNKTLNLNFPKANGNTDNTYSTKITYNVYDQNGFLVDTADPEPLQDGSAVVGNVGKIYYDITLGNENKTPTSGNVFKAYDASANYGKGQKAKNGTYVVRLYKIVEVAGATATTYHAQQLNSASFVVSDDTTALALTQKENQIVYSASANRTGVAEAVKNVITIKRGTDDITGKLIYNSADYKEVNGKLYVNKLNVTETYSKDNTNSFTYTYDITVNMLFEVTNTPGLVVTFSSNVVSVTSASIDADVTFTVKRGGVDEDGCTFAATYMKDGKALKVDPTGLTLNSGSKTFEITESTIENATYDVTLTVTKGNEAVTKSFKIVVAKE